MANSRYLWLFGEEQEPYIIVTAGAEHDAYKTAIRKRVEWASYPPHMTWRDRYRDAIRRFIRENDRIICLDDAEEIED